MCMDRPISGLLLLVLLVSCVEGSVIFLGRVQGNTNLLVNGDFETGDLSGWSNSSGAVGVVNTVVHSGSYSAMIKSDGWDNQVAQYLGLPGDQNYFLGGWVYPLLTGSVGSYDYPWSGFYFDFFNRSSMTHALYAMYYWCWNDLDQNSSTEVFIHLNFNANEWNHLLINVTQDVRSYFTSINFSELEIYRITFAYHFSKVSPGAFYIDDLALSEGAPPRQGPTVRFTCSSATAKVDQPLVFNASTCLSGSNGTYPTPITEYDWNFGDSNMASTDQPVILHSFTYVNVFNVTLTVTDSQDLSSSCSKNVTVVMPTTLSVTTNSTSTVLGYIVNVYGNLSDAHGNGMANETVILYYTFPGLSTWYPISSGSTDAHGQYYVQWMPQATGYFTIRAEWAGNATHLASNDTVTLGVLPYQNTYAFSVESNSTVSGLTFDTSSQTLVFSVSGENGTEGYARVTIAKALVPDVTKLQVRLDGVDYSYSAVSLDDSWLLTFTYSHSTHQVEVLLNTNAVPEFPSTNILAVLMALATFAAVLVKKRLKRLYRDPVS